MASMTEKRGILDGCSGKQVQIPAVQKRVLLPVLWPVDVLQWSGHHQPQPSAGNDAFRVCRTFWFCPWSVLSDSESSGRSPREFGGMTLCCWEHMDRTDRHCAIKPNQMKTHLMGRTVTLEHKEYVFRDEENLKQILGLFCSLWIISFFMRIDRWMSCFYRSHEISPCWFALSHMLKRIKYNYL